MFKNRILLSFAGILLFSVICFGACKKKEEPTIEPVEQSSSVPVYYDLVVKGNVEIDGNSIAVDFVANNIKPLKGENQGEDIRKMIEEHLGVDVKYDVHVTGYLNIYGMKLDIDKDFSNK